MIKLAACILLSSISVIDGDTIEIGGKRIRIVGIDTPETYYAKCEKEKRLGDQATEKLRSKLSQGCVQLKYLPYQDRHNRTLARVFVNRVDIAKIARTSACLKSRIICSTLCRFLPITPSIISNIDAISRDKNWS